MQDMPVYVFLHVIPVEVMCLSVCLGLILTIWLPLAHFFYTETLNGLITHRMENNPSLDLSSVPLQNPKLLPQWASYDTHTRTHTGLISSDWYLSLVFSFPSMSQSAPICSRSSGRTLEWVCMSMTCVDSHSSSVLTVKQDQANCWLC